MSYRKSRARLAADWFAKLRINAITQEIEHEDVKAVEDEVKAVEGDVVAVESTATATEAAKMEHNDYASNTTGGTLKARLSGTNLYLTNNGTNA